MMSSDESEDAGQRWERIETREAFVSSFADRPLYGTAVVFTIHSSRRLTGTIEGKKLSGEWFWNDGLF